MKIKPLVLVTVLSVVTLSGCASYRVDSNIKSVQPVAVSAKENIIITEKTLPAGTFTLIGPIDVSVKKLTVFHKDPTREQANEALRERAISIGADAVMQVRYTSGIGMTTWGYLDAEGKAVKLLNK
ncbi:hypothetical protein DN062_13625 [Nitrincola tibetensis]|uniref:Heavy metal-binding domain-containing protein n=1 Tax=Nitrincola tibetensis TaxID=2219697 RepID=A0A364NJZ5_9GAMM|nr:heavy metal-binding domain-containing protein [Nitrincola tibetensis]RAU17207.1 hypothetical protein DN062_13625 [Nitrincola tibetensis]